MAEKTTVAANKTNTQVIPNEDYDYKIEAPLFIKFAEYVGYVSDLIEWCDELCEGKDIEDYKKKFIEVEAKNVFDDMVKDMTLEKVKSYYEAFYSVILYLWDENLEKLKSKKK